MAIASSSLAFKRAALMSATKVTTKPPSEEVLRARDDFYDFALQKVAAHWRHKNYVREDSECLMIEDQTLILHHGTAKALSLVCSLLDDW